MTKVCLRGRLLPGERGLLNRKVYKGRFYEIYDKVKHPVDLGVTDWSGFWLVLQRGP